MQGLKILKIMPNETLEKFINDPKILYIYETGIQVYGLFPDIEDRDFLLICDNDYVPEGFIPYSKDEYLYDENGTYQYRMFPIKRWFNEVLSNSMLAWECACLNKKFIHKEHVKLLVQTNPVQLRKDYDAEQNQLIESASELIKAGNTLTGQKMLWYLVKYVMFANQIIENHKIVKFKEPLDSYKKIVNGQISDLDTILQTFKEELYPHLERFKKYTDEPLRLSKIKKIIQNG